MLGFKKLRFAQVEDKRAEMERQLNSMKRQHESIQKQHALTKQHMHRMKVIEFMVLKILSFFVVALFR